MAQLNRSDRSGWIRIIARRTSLVIVLGLAWGAAVELQTSQLARLIRNRVSSAADGPAFRYRDFGRLATIGRKAAVADLGRIQLSGWVAWVLWSVAHIYFLIGARNRVAVLITWIWAYITFQHGTRLITGSDTERAAAAVTVPEPSGAQP